MSPGRGDAAVGHLDAAGDDRRAGRERLDIGAVAAAAIAEVGVEALDIGFERRRRLPLQRTVQLVPLDIALLREILEDAGKQKPIDIERTRGGAAALEQERNSGV